MMRWLLYLAALAVLSLVALLVTPLLPAFAAPRLGPVNNNNGTAVEPRLPRWLAWFDTPDNSLLGDSGWRATHGGGYGAQVAWLYRNSLYGFKWGPIAAPMSVDRVIKGDPTINRNNGHYGVLRIAMGDYWQWKCVQPLGATGYCWMINLGWLLDDAGQQKALFLFSPRLVKITARGAAG